MADNGGSTGVLRDELGVLPPGDVRQCLVALSEHSDIVRELMNYRFENGGLGGHSFGNIFLAALEKVTGDFVKGVEIASEILKVKGKVIPTTSNKAELGLLLLDGTLLKGESKITESNIQEIGIKKIFYKEKVDLNENAKQAILDADYIILGPGNFYSSIIPNIIVNGFKETIKESKAKIVFLINLTNKQGHTMHWNVDKYVHVLEEYLAKPIDIILVNNELPSKEQIEHYKLEEGDGVLISDDSKDARVIREPLLSHAFIIPKKEDRIGTTRSFIRHDSTKLANCMKQIIKN
jgi:uncharacterized cofD-like protein